MNSNISKAELYRKLKHYILWEEGMIMGNYDVRNATISILDILKYDAIQDEDGVIYKDMGKYVQMLVPMKNEKQHDTYEVYFSDDGRIVKVVGHRGNAGFVGTRYF